MEAYLMTDSNVNDFSAEQREIVLSIREGRPVSDEQANWAVKFELATQGEDGDIDLIQKGRHLLG
jgi:hypothetical protein